MHTQLPICLISENRCTACPGLHGTLTNIRCTSSQTRHCPRGTQVIKLTDSNLGSSIHVVCKVPTCRHALVARQQCRWRAQHLGSSNAARHSLVGLEVCAVDDHLAEAPEDLFAAVRKALWHRDRWQLHLSSHDPLRRHLCTAKPT